MCVPTLCVPTFCVSMPPSPPPNAAIEVQPSPRLPPLHPRPRRFARPLRLLLVLLALAAAAAVGWLCIQHRAAILARFLTLLQAVQALGPLRGTLLLVCMQVAGFVLLIPTSILSVAAGAAFGLQIGIAAAAAGYLTGSLFPFFLSRRVLSATATRLVRSYPLASGVLAAVDEQPFLLIVLLRLSPALPAPVNCYLLGLTSVPTSTYLVATALGAAPNCVFCVYLGSLMQSIAEVLQGDGAAPPWPLIVLGLAATVGALALISSVARRKVSLPLRPPSPNCCLTAPASARVAGGANHGERRGGGEAARGARGLLFGRRQRRDEAAITRWLSLLPHALRVDAASSRRAPSACVVSYLLTSSTKSAWGALTPSV